MLRSTNKYLIFLFLALIVIFTISQAFTLSEQSQLRIFSDAKEEELKSTKWDIGNTTISNEHRLDLFYNSIRNLGEGFIGVGTTQNFSLAAVANSEWVWLMDFTRIVVAANKIHVAFLKRAETASKFRKLWFEESSKIAADIIKKEYRNDPDLQFILKTWHSARKFVMWRFRCLNHVVKKRGFSTWFTDRLLYNRIRNLALRGHIKILKGDLQGTITLRGIASAAREMGVNINVLYMSNAEEYFKYMKEDFRYNIKQMPITSRSIILRTTTIYYWKLLWAPDSDFQNSIGFHYNTMKIDLFNKYLANGKSDLYIWDILKNAKIYGETGYSQVTVYPARRRTR